MDWQLHLKHIHSLTAFSPYFSSVLSGDAVRDGKTQSEAMVHTPCLVCCISRRRTSVCIQIQKIVSATAEQKYKHLKGLLQRQSARHLRCLFDYNVFILRIILQLLLFCRFLQMDYKFQRKQRQSRTQLHRYKAEYCLQVHFPLHRLRQPTKSR